MRGCVGAVPIRRCRVLRNIFLGSFRGFDAPSSAPRFPSEEVTLQDVRTPTDYLLKRVDVGVERKSDELSHLFTVYRQCLRLWVFGHRLGQIEEME